MLPRTRRSGFGRRNGLGEGAQDRGQGRTIDLALGGQGDAVAAIDDIAVVNEPSPRQRFVAQRATERLAVLPGREVDVPAGENQRRPLPVIRQRNMSQEPLLRWE